MKIRTVYLAGGINGLSNAEANDWRSEVKRLLPSEVGVLDPMSRDYRGREDGNAWEIVLGDLGDLAESDAVIANCSRPSWGTGMEIHRAALWNTRVVAVVPDGTPVSPWLRVHADAVVPTLEDAVERIKEWSK